MEVRMEDIRRWDRKHPQSYISIIYYSKKDSKKDSIEGKLQIVSPDLNYFTIKTEDGKIKRFTTDINYSLNKIVFEYSFNPKKPLKIEKEPTHIGGIPLGEINPSELEASSYDFDLDNPFK